MTRGRLGLIDTPAQGNKHVPGAAWCADNGCFGEGYPGDDAWLAWITQRSVDVASCLFAVAPDVVGDAVATRARSIPLLSQIRALGYPAAFVAQNGIEKTCVPWDAFDVLFIGGSPECVPCGYVRPPDKENRKRKVCPHCNRRLKEWKLGPIARSLASDAKVRGKWVHMGRVNSWTRLRYAASIGCDSADGTYVKFGPDQNLPKALSWIHEVNSQMVLDL